MKTIHKHWFIIIPLLGLGIAAAWIFEGQAVLMAFIVAGFALGAGAQLSIWRIRADRDKQGAPQADVSVTTAAQSVEIVMKKLIENLPIGIMFITNEETIRFSNRIWHELLGHDRDLRLADFKEHSGVWSALNRALGTEDDGEYLWQVGKKHYQIVIKSVHAAEKFIGIIVSGSDVSSFKNLERVQQDFLADITHELKTPIAALMGASDILVQRGPLLPADQLSEFHTIIEKEAGRLNRLVDDLIDLTRIGSNALNLTKSLVSLLELAEETAQTFKQDMQEKQLTLTLKIDPALLVFVDRGRFIQVLTNLFSNAVRYTESGGITISAAKEDKTIAIYFQDTGMGIDAENLPLIFNRFYRADEARSRYAGGSGLGLAIVREIVLSHRGTIEAKSRLGHGTTFLIRIPKI